MRVGCKPLPRRNYRGRIGRTRTFRLAGSSAPLTRRFTCKTMGLLPRRVAQPPALTVACSGMTMAVLDLESY